MSTEMKTVVTGVAFPECLRWHEGKLWFSDVLGGKVFNFDASTSVVHKVADLPPMAGGLGWLANGDFLAVDIDARKVVKIGEGGATSVYVDLSHEWKFPANDMLIDDSGTIWVGGFGYNPETDAPRGSSLARFREGRLDFPVDGLVFANGIGQLDARHLVVAETFADRLAILTIHSDNRVTIEKRIQLPQGASPDGLTVDSHGKIWVASAYGEAVLKVDADTEEIERAVEIPGRGVFDCVFGGPDMRTLYIATSDVDESRALIDLPGEILAIEI